MQSGRAVPRGNMGCSCTLSERARIKFPTSPFEVCAARGLDVEEKGYPLSSGRTEDCFVVSQRRQSILCDFACVL